MMPTSSFPVCDIRDYGATTQNLASLGINQAIRACASAGGGMVFIPPGVWRCGTIEMASDITLFLSAGATLQSSLDLEDFYQIDGMLHGRALIAGFNCRNITLTGEGCIDGRGPDFMDWTQNIPAQGKYSDEHPEGPVLPKDRIDRMVYFHDCQNVRIHDLRLRESAQWCVTLVGCEDAWCTNLDIYGHERIPNNDGIHLCYCRRVTIHGCHIHSADDAIALTSEKGGNNDDEALHWSAEEMLNPPWCEDITISNCVLQTHGSGVRIGHMDDFVRRVRIHDCIVPSCHRGFLVSARNNGRVENILVHDCRVQATLYAGIWWGGAEPFLVSAMGAGSGHIRNIEFSNIDADCEHGALIWTDARFTVSDIRLLRCRFKLNNTRHGENLGGYFDLRPRSIERDIPSGYFKHTIAGIYAHRINDIKVQDCTVEFPENPAAYFSSGIRAASCTGAILKDNLAPSILEDSHIDY